MRMQCMHSTVFAAAVLLLPTAIVAQMDPNASPGASSYPQSPQNMNQPAGPGSSTGPTGAQTTPSTSMRDSLGAPGETGQQMADKQFLRASAQSGVADVKMASLAVDKGGPGVKTLAQQMLDDHTAINKDMGNVADSMGVMLPKKMSKDEQAEYDKLSSLSGKDFDTEYVTYMAKTHWQDLHNFHVEASAASDSELEEAVVKAMGTMHDHIGMIAKTAAAEGITLPPRPPRPAPAATASK